MWVSTFSLHRLVNVIAAVMASAVIPLAAAQTPGVPVAPRQAFSSDVLNVDAPDSDGWVLAGNASNGVVFARRGHDRYQTFVAQAVLFDMPPTTTQGDLLELVSRRIAALNPAPRFQVLQATYRYSAERGYPCVNADLAYDDRAAATPNGPQAMKLQVIAMYCRHPQRSDLGFVAAFSHRHERLLGDLAPMAAGFLAGVTAPR